MGDSTLDAYVAEIAARGLDARAEPLVRALDRVILEAHPALDVAIKYRILMYTIGNDWRTWVCAIDATTRGVALRFLYGVILDDPRGVLRAGSSVLKTWDFGFDAEIDAVAVASYVADAVARHGDYKANAPAILAAARSAGKGAG